ncbi:MAG: alpha/beta hydrolase, partial [Oscillospiraceae bacterium]|nr:alpha/beta hydrolase [Oscillospiraceae bacterium]
KGWQVLSLDLPQHGERKDEPGFDPWHIVPELRRIMDGVRPQYRRFALRANSIGAWFAMLAFEDQPLERCLFVSAVVDMNRLIDTMMGWAGVTPQQLESARFIPTDFGQTLSWEYFLYAKEHPVTEWKSPTFLLYGENDEMVKRRDIENFARKFGCRLTVTEGGEHWFHTPLQLEALKRWEQENLD